MRILLDSNAYTLLMHGHKQIANLARDAEQLLLSAVVVAELLYGFRWGAHFEQNVAQLRAFLDGPRASFVPIGLVTADRYGRIAASLRAKGRPIPTNDIWIAAQVMETGADLASADAHFEHVDGLAWTRLTVN